jgi:para-aminobenzoate synthetase component 2
MGATVTSAPELMHGKTSKINHQNSTILDGIHQGFTATRYHSLAVVKETVPEDLEITGQTESGVIMSLQHKSKPIYGVQFHPESVMTEGGYMMLANWLETLGLAGAREKAKQLSPRISK